MKFDSSLPIRDRIKKRRRQKRIRVLIILSALIAFVLCSFILFANIDKDTKAGSGSSFTKAQDSKVEGITANNNNPEEKNTTGEKTNITLETAKDLESLKVNIEQYIKGFKGTYGVYYSSLGKAEEFGINDVEEYIAASTFKIPTNLYLYEKISVGYVKRDGTLKYIKEDYEEGTGILQYEEFGKKYEIHELSKLSIEKSDNVATNMLLRFLDKQKVRKYMRQCGGIVVKDEENVSCPKDMALYIRKVFEFSKKNVKLGKELMGYFENTEFNSRIPALLPENVRIAHKTGNQVCAVHDVGIVFAEKPYILSVMSKEVNENEADEVIANISKMVYDYAIKVR